MEDRPVLTEAEKWELKRKRSAPTQPVDDDEEDVEYHERYAGKGPVFTQVEDVEDEDEEEGEEPRDEPDDADHGLPNLHEYFQNFDVTDEKVISMCRAYASYLSSLRPKKPTSAYATPRRRQTATDQEPPSQKQRYWETKRRRK